MARSIGIDANKAISILSHALARDYHNGAENRERLRHWLDDLGRPVSYSNQDIDRAAQFHDFLVGLVLDSK